MMLKKLFQSCLRVNFRRTEFHSKNEKAIKAGPGLLGGYVDLQAHAGTYCAVEIDQPLEFVGNEEVSAIGVDGGVRISAGIGPDIERQFDQCSNCLHRECGAGISKHDEAVRAMVHH